MPRSGSIRNISLAGHEQILYMRHVREKCNADVWVAMDCKFQVGDMVVCVKTLSDKDRGRGCPNFPRSGLIYTIREMIDHGIYGIGVRLNEIVNAPYNWANGFQEATFAPEWFRPIRRTDISALRHLVLSPKEPVA